MRLLRDIFVVGTACFFAVMWGLVLRERLAVPPAPAMKPNYDALLTKDEQRREFTMGIYLGDKRLGTTRTEIERIESGGIGVHNNTRLELGALPKYIAPLASGLEVDFYADISPLQGLRMVRLFSDALGVRLVGTVDEGRLAIRGIVGKQRFETDIPYDEGLLLGEALSPMAGFPDLRHARVGDAWSVHVINPLVGSVQEVRVNLESIREVELHGRKRRVYRLLFHASNRVWLTWITDDGAVLVQGTPFGLTLRRDDLTPEVLAALGEPRADEIRSRHE